MMLEDERVAEIKEDYLSAHAAELYAKISHKDAIIACMWVVPRVFEI